MPSTTKAKTRTPAKSAAKSTGRTATKTAARPAKKPAAKTATKSRARTTAKAPAKPPAKTPTKSAAKAAPKKASKTAAKTAPKSRAKAAAKSAARRPTVNGKNYVPSEKEPYMGKKQLQYFRDKLTAMKEEILQMNRETILEMQENAVPIPDIVDRASSEADRALELRTRDRQRKHVAKIDSAIRRIDEGEYGYCDQTGEPIGLKRLEARPTATLCLEAQERHERMERTVRDD